MKLKIPKNNIIADILTKRVLGLHLTILRKHDSKIVILLLKKTRS
jgi:hypothetical protein